MRRNDRRGLSELRTRAAVSIHRLRRKCVRAGVVTFKNTIAVRVGVAVFIDLAIAIIVDSVACLGLAGMNGGKAVVTILRIRDEPDGLVAGLRTC